MPQFPSVDALLTDAISHQVFPGAAYGVLQRGKPVLLASIGGFTYQPDSPRVEPETVFDMASVTKAMATTAMAMLLWQRGQLDLDEPVAAWLPEFLRTAVAMGAVDDARQHVTVRMLLGHCSGLPAYARLFEQHSTSPALLNACLEMPLEATPGTRAVYSDIGFIILGRLLEAVAGERLDKFCHREIFMPLGMNSTMFCPPAERKPAIPPTSTGDNFRSGIVQGEVHDENCWVLGGVSGHAGLFSNVADTLRFAACLLCGGDPLFQSETVALFTSRQKDPPATEWALGWDTPTTPSSSGQFFSPHSAGHLGYTGTSLWIDFEKDLAIVLLTNRTYPGGVAEKVSKNIQQVRPRFHDVLMRELGWSVPGKVLPGSAS